MKNLKSLNLNKKQGKKTKKLLNQVVDKKTVNKKSFNLVNIKETN